MNPLIKNVLYNACSKKCQIKYSKNIQVWKNPVSKVGFGFVVHVIQLSDRFIYVL